MSARPLVVYEDFSGGEWGRLGQHKAAKNQFHGLNVLVYGDGQIGPRPGARRFLGGYSPSGVKPHSMNRREGTGTVWWSWVESGSMFAAQFDSTVAPLTPGDVDIVGFGVGPTTATATQRGQSYGEPDGSQSYFASQDSVWVVQHSPITLAHLAGTPPNCRCLVYYGDRIVVAQGNTLRYSAPANPYPIVWPAANSIVVGKSAIRGLYVVRGTLVIVKKDYSIWLLSGVPGVNEVLRQVLPRTTGHVDAFDFEAADNDALGRLWMTFPGIDAPSNVSPALFAGSVPQFFRDHEQNAYREPDAYVKWSQQDTARAMVTGLANADSVAMFTASNQTAGEDGNLLIRHNGVWTKHLIQWPNSEHPSFATHVGDGRVVVAAENTAGGIGGFGASQVWEPWSVQAAWDRIPVLGDDFYGLMRLGDDSDTPVNANFETSEWWDENGRDVTVSEILVDLTIANIVGDSGLPPINCGFDCSVIRVGLDNAFDPRGASDRYSGGSFNVSIDPNSFSAGSGSIDGEMAPFGVQRTIRIPITPTQARGFKIRFDNIVGCSFRRISVFGQLDPARA